MAILRSKEIWDMEVDEIQDKLVELRAELSKNVSKSAAAGVIENPGKIRVLKRTIARVLTILNEKQKENQHKADIAKLKPDLVNYAAKLQEEGYTNYTEHSKKNTEEKKDDPMPNEPYVISPDNYGENDNYTQISLVYYAGDEVLADDEDEVVEDIEDTVGEDFAEHFGEYEDDSVFIRNDRLRCDYEILRDNRSFSDVAEGSNY